MIADLINNIEAEFKIIKEISYCLKKRRKAERREQQILEKRIISLQNRIRAINLSLPAIIQNISILKALPAQARTAPIKTELERIYIDKKSNAPDSRIIPLGVTLTRQNKRDFLRELDINEDAFNNVGEYRKKEDTNEPETQSPRIYLKLANSIFRAIASRIAQQNWVKLLKSDLRKANMDYLLESYIALMLFWTTCAFIAGIGLSIFLLFYNIGISYPFLSVYGGSIQQRLTIVAWLPFVFSLCTFIFLYIYPSTEKKSIARRINQELPFAAVQMSAISGSGVEPTTIFRIIAVSREYPALRKEIRKVLNQINLYGYDLVTAINNVAQATSSQRLAELFAGLSTTINSGGRLGDFFAKRAETLLTQYRLEREQFTKTAETFMDLYITIVIAAPMVLLLIFVLLSLSNFGVNLSPQYMTFIIIGLVSTLNILFLAFLNLKQPPY